MRSRCCTAIAPSGASTADCCSIRSVRYGCRRTRSHSPAPSGPRLSQIAFETPSRPKSCTSPARRSVRTSASGRPSCAPAAAARSATAREWPRVYGDLRSTKFAIATSAASKRSHERTTASVGSASITASQVSSVVEALQDHLAFGADQLGEVRIELVVGALARESLGGLDATGAVCDLERTPQAARCAPRVGSPRP